MFKNWLILFIILREICVCAYCLFKAKLLLFLVCFIAKQGNNHGILAVIITIIIVLGFWFNYIILETILQYMVLNFIWLCFKFIKSSKEYTIIILFRCVVEYYTYCNITGILDDYGRYYVLVLHRIGLTSSGFVFCMFNWKSHGLLCCGLCTEWADWWLFTDHQLL